MPKQTRAELITEKEPEVKPLEDKVESAMETSSSLKICSNCDTPRSTSIICPLTKPPGIQYGSKSPPICKTGPVCSECTKLCSCCNTYVCVGCIKKCLGCRYFTCLACMSKGTCWECDREKQDLKRVGAYDDSDDDKVDRGSTVVYEESEQTSDESDSEYADESEESDSEDTN